VVPAGVTSPVAVVPPAVVAPVTSAAASVPAVSITPVDSQTIIMAAALVQMREGKASAEAVWQNDHLTAESVLHALETPGIVDAWNDEKLRAELAGLLAAHAPEKLQPSSKLKDAVKLALADYYAGQKDAKAVGLYEELLAAITGPARKEAEMPLPLLHLAAYYEAAGDYVKAAQTWLRAEKYTLSAQQVADATMHAARLYIAAGDEMKAHELYDRVPQYGRAWMTGVALWDQATALIIQGQHQQARKLLLTPVTGQYADQIKVALLSKLSYSYYRTGEWEQARQYGQAAVEQYQQLKEPLKDEGLEGQVGASKEILRLIKHWTKEPIICAPRELHLVASNDQSKPLVARLSIRSFQLIPLTVTANKPGVKVSVSGKTTEGDEDNCHFFGQEVLVQIAPEAFKKDLETVLTIQSSKVPNFQAHVSVSVEAVPPKSDDEKPKP